MRNQSQIKVIVANLFFLNFAFFLYHHQPSRPRLTLLPLFSKPSRPTSPSVLLPSFPSNPLILMNFQPSLHDPTSVIVAAALSAKPSRLYHQPKPQRLLLFSLP